MARALCELQLELMRPTYTEGHTHETPTTKLAPKTPVQKETTKRKIKLQEKSRNVSKRWAEVKSAREADATSKADFAETSVNIHEPNILGVVSESIEKTDLPSNSGIGNFPSPKELASLDVNFLGKRCNLGYRASRILGLAQSVVEGRIQLRQFDEDSGEKSLSNYMKLNEQLGNVNGFGPFTRANVLMCLGFFHVIPSDSETLRHLNQVSV